jgi:predicted Rossmann fold flavoprotein
MAEERGDGRRRVVVIGGGAAGVTAAIFAAGSGADVLLLESTSDGGRKILISGGGRCNVLPSVLDPGRYFTSSSPNTLKKMLLSWPLASQRAFFEETLGIGLALEEDSGKLFPVSNRARDVRDGLFSHARESGVRISFGSRVTGVDRGEGGYLVRTESGTVEAAAVVLATGGLSVPKTGSEGFGLRLAALLGHTVRETYPALTPLTCEPPVHGELAGVSLEVRIHAPPPGGPFETTGGFLFTHRGYSGPAVLNVSHLAVRSRLTGSAPQRVLVQWTPLGAGEWEAELVRGGGARLLPLLRRNLPDRLAERLLSEAGVDGQRPLAQLRREERQVVVDLLTRYPLPWTGDEGYKKAEVTGGGVALGEVHPSTMESRLHPGLYLCGEVLDAFGPIGGYNFAWAWATGRAAGIGASRPST